MPGVPLNLPIPLLSDTQTVVVTKTAQALAAIDADLSAQVTASEININAPLSFNGNSATNVGSLVLNRATVDLTEGSVFYSNSGEFLLVTADGIIQITSNGGINVSGVGGIGGDYTAVSALLSYDNALTRYRFFGSGGTTLVDLNARKLALAGTLANVTFGVDATLAANKTINIKSLPTSNVGLICYDATNTAIVDGTATNISATHTFTGVQTFNGNVVQNAQVKHPAYSMEIPLTVSHEANAGLTFSPGGVSGISVSAWSSLPFQIRAGEIVNTFTTTMTKGSTDPTTIRIVKRVAGVDTTVQSVIRSTSGTSLVTVTVAAPVAIAAGERWRAEIQQTAGAAGWSISDAGITWTQ